MDTTRHDIPTSLGPLAIRTAGEGPAAVFWHSAYVDSRSFDRVAERLAVDRHVVLIDGPGHGHSQGPGRLFDLEECADAAVEVIETLGLDAVDWVGSAWGGHVGVIIAARESHPISSLAAFCAPMQPIDPGSRPKLRLLMLMYRLLGMRGPVRSGLLDALLAPENRAANPDLERYVVEAASPSDRSALLWAMKSIVLQRPSLVERLTQIDIPTLFVTGDNPLWPIDLASAQAGLIPRGEFLHMPGVRHLPPLEKPVETTALLRSWWSR